jgi:hypothetical protein
MGKRKLSPKKYAKKRGNELSQDYIIKYGPDGSTFQVFNKNDESDIPLSIDDLMRVDDRRFLNRRKKLVTREFEKLAEQKRTPNKESEENTINSDLQKRLAKLDILENTIGSLKNTIAEQNKRIDNLISLANSRKEQQATVNKNIVQKNNQNRLKAEQEKDQNVLSTEKTETENVPGTTEDNNEANITNNVTTVKETEDNKKVTQTTTSDDIDNIYKSLRFIPGNEVFAKSDGTLSSKDVRDANKLGLKYISIYGNILDTKKAMELLNAANVYNSKDVYPIVKKVAILPGYKTNKFYYKDRIRDISKFQQQLGEGEDVLDYLTNSDIYKDNIGKITKKDGKLFYLSEKGPVEIDPYSTENIIHVYGDKYPEVFDAKELLRYIYKNKNKSKSDININPYELY